MGLLTAMERARYGRTCVSFTARSRGSWQVSRFGATSVTLTTLPSAPGHAPVLSSVSGLDEKKFFLPRSAGFKMYHVFFVVLYSSTVSRS